MKIDATIPHEPDATTDLAARFEADGYDGIWTGETKHDPFLQLLLAAEATERVTLGTSIAIAFGRSPLTLAHTAYDMAGYSRGRFVLGIGSQVKAHIERRFSMPWSHPAARMREFVLALRAIWASWEEGTQLDFRGEFYTHTLMTPFFSPAPHEFGPPPVHLAAVGERMTEVAGEVCDGIFVHPFTTRRYLDEVTLPALRRGRAQAASDDLTGFTVNGLVFVAIGRDQAELDAAIRGTKQQIAFYASTPAYRGVLELHGRADLQPELTRMSKEGQWEQMADLIDDDLLGLVAVVGDPESVGAGVAEHWADRYDRASLYVNYSLDRDARAARLLPLSGEHWAPEMSDAVRADELFHSIPGILEVVAAKEGERTAIVDGEVRLTFAELHRTALDATRAAIAMGIEPGDRAAIWAPNTFEWVVAALGVLGAGGVLVPINTRYKGLEAADIIERSGATTLFTVDGFLGLHFASMLEEVAPKSAVLDRCVTLRGEGAVTYEEFLASGNRISMDVAQRRISRIEPDDLSDIMFTSGTTGAPKGVMLGHGQSLRAFDAFNAGFGLTRDDSMAVVAPFFHCFGYKAGWMLCLMTGATCHPMATFDARSMLELIEQEKISVIAGAPTMMADILGLLATEPHDVSSLRYAFTSAATVPFDLIVRMREELGVEAVGTGYGLTEASAMVSVTKHEDGPEIIATTSGRPIPGTEIKTIDQQGHDTGSGEPGELLVRGFNVMRGYWEDVASTEAAIDHEGWLHTGDVATIDADGYLKITDRLKDMFIVGGFNAYPAEIEALLLGDHRIAQVAVVGIPDERLGEVGAAFVVPRPGAQLSGEDVILWAREHLANFKVPRRVEIVAQLPLNATGKVLKDALRERASHTSD